MPLQQGEKLGPYEIISAIGKGGMGEVYQARDPRLRRDVAIKFPRRASVSDSSGTAGRATNTAAARTILGESL
jgi:serine/threonine protein kinase